MGTNTVTINNVRFSYVHLMEAYAQQQGAEPKFSTTILVLKTDTSAKATIDSAVRSAIELGKDKAWKGAVPPAPALCVHDGDGPRPSDGMPFGPECKGCWVFTASSKNRPFVVDVNMNNIIDPAQLYSGMYGNVSVTFFAYANSGKKGIGCGLNGVQKTQEGEALAGHVSAEEAFGTPAAAPASVQGYPPEAAYPVAPGQMPYGVPQPQAYPGYPAQQAPAYPGQAAPAYPSAQSPAPQYGGVTINPATGLPY